MDEIYIILESLKRRIEQDILSGSCCDWGYVGAFNDGVRRVINTVDLFVENLKISNKD